MYISIADYAKKYDISIAKVKRMAPKLKGAKQCPNCKKWQIPTSAIPIYIPNKRLYKNFAKKHCYVMDSIALNMQLDNDLSGISSHEITTILKELERQNLIILKENVKSKKTKNTDYELSKEGINWANKQTEEKNKLIFEILKTIQTTAKTIGDIATTFKSQNK